MTEQATRRVVFRRSSKSTPDGPPARFAVLARRSRTAVTVWLALNFLAHCQLGRVLADAEKQGEAKRISRTPPRRLHTTRKAIANVAGIKRLATVTCALNDLETLGWIARYLGSIKAAGNWVGKTLRIDLRVDIAAALNAFTEKGTGKTLRAAVAVRLRQRPDRTNPAQRRKGSESLFSSEHILYPRRTAPSPL